MVEHHAMPVVQTVGLCKVFRDFWRRPRVEAVKDLSLEIHPGEVFGLLGPNGSGKTTTIKMLLGLLYPTKGRIALFGRPLVTARFTVPVYPFTWPTVTV